MIYRDFMGLKLSALGLGTMRLPVVGGKGSDIDESLTAEMIAFAMENGINYYDTAYMYHAGNSEKVVGKILSGYPRDSFFLADKFPGFSEEAFSSPARIFEEQLAKCCTDRFDFYLFHSVTEKNIGGYLDPKYGIMDYLREQKKSGRIGHIGFSCHGDIDCLRRFLDAYRGELDFCQLEVNWFDWTYEKAAGSVALLREYGVPLWVMEPLRGGKLARIGEKYVSELNKLRPDETVPAWSFRFQQTIGATVVLSGMSDMEQLRQNIMTFSSDRPLNNAEFKALVDMGEDMQKSNMVPCTGCRYCTTVCPMELDIPKIIDIYNDNCFSGVVSVPQRAWRRFDPEKTPSACIGCRACEGICPQGIEVAGIMEMLKE